MRNCVLVQLYTRYCSIIYHHHLPLLNSFLRLILFCCAAGTTTTTAAIQGSIIMAKRLRVAGSCHPPCRYRQYFSGILLATTTRSRLCVVWLALNSQGGRHEQARRQEGPSQKMRRSVCGVEKPYYASPDTAPPLP